MNVRLNGKPIPENWHIMATKQKDYWHVCWTHIKNEKQEKIEHLTDQEYHNKYEAL